jgi:hypothetical protein
MKEEKTEAKLSCHCPFKLTVNFSVPADPILIYDEEGRERITFVGPYTENQDTKITCKAYGGTALFKGLRRYGGSIRFKGPVKVKFVLRAYRGRYSLFGAFESTVRLLKAYGGTVRF